MSRNVRAPELYPARHNWLVRRHGDAVRAAGPGIDPAVLGAELGIQPRTVMMIQRKLGLRKCASHGNNRAGE